MNEHNITPDDSLNSQSKDNQFIQNEPVFDLKKLDISEEDLINEPNFLEDYKSTNLFNILPANEVIKLALSQPDPLQLYPVLIMENEFTVLFGDTGVGKSVLAFQMAIHIAEKGFTTLYLDLELTRKQFQKRYTGNDGLPFILPNNLYRAEFARLKEIPKGLTYEDFFFKSLIQEIEEKDAKVIFLDNLTKLAAGDTDSAKAAIPILEKLNKLKADFNITIIVLEHNKKVNTSRPIQLNDLQGSKMKGNLVDAVFTIGRSAKEKQLRYIKQLKVRDGEEIYVTESVQVVELSKSKGYLSFNNIDFANENEHLRKHNEMDKIETIEKAKELGKQGMSQRGIASELGISVGLANKYIHMQNVNGVHDVHGVHV